jgi:hypothetical protein
MVLPTSDTEEVMSKLFGLFSALALMAALLSSIGLAVDNCGHGAHRNPAGVCVLNENSNDKIPIRLMHDLERR